MPIRAEHQSDRNPPAGQASACPEPLVEGFALGPFATNCYIVRVPGGADPSACWIVDASFSPRPLIDRVREAGLRPERFILTHAHLDHIAGLDELRCAFPGVPAVIHDAERGFLEDPELNLSAGYGFPVSVRAAESTLKGGETLHLSGTSWNVFHTPGHSPGGITLWWDGRPTGRPGIAIVGDTLFYESVGRYDFPTSDQAALERSIRDVLYPLPDDTRILPGHGPETTIGHEKRSNPFVRG